MTDPAIVTANPVLVQAREKLDEALCIFDTLDVGSVDSNLQALSEALLMAGILVQKAATQRLAAAGAPPALLEA